MLFCWKMQDQSKGYVNGSITLDSDPLSIDQVDNKSQWTLYFGV